MGNRPMATYMSNSKTELTNNIVILLHSSEDLDLDVSLLTLIAKHLSKMPKRTRIPFLEALNKLIQKSSEYDQMQFYGNSDADTCGVHIKNPEWNK